MIDQLLGYRHRFISAAAPEQAPTLLLLHGTGGNEDSLLPIGHDLAPRASLLSPRGQVLENGMPRFFRRLAEGVLDIPDLQRRTVELGAFLDQAAQHYGFDRRRVIAVGYSNGANIAASMLLQHSDALAGAILFHPMVPFVPDRQPPLSATPIFIGAGRLDPLIPAGHSEQLAEMLRRAGGQVSLAWQPGGHTLTGAEVEEARRWLADSGLLRS